MATREFDLGDVLSITTDRLLSEHGIKGVYEILNFMTGESLFTHQLPRVRREAAPVILKVHPQLRTIDDSSVTPDNWKQFLADQKAKFGERLSIPTLTADQHERIEPVSELAEHVHPDRIITVKV